MSLRIIRAGVFDSIQDGGRLGYQHLGINPGGAMDRFSASLANALLGKPLNAPVLELHFPSSHIQFEEATVICLCGADFSATINGRHVPLHHPVIVPKNSLLRFNHILSGARAYLAVLHDLHIERWLNSYTTNVKASAGGWHGRTLMKDDEIVFEEDKALSAFLRGKEFTPLHWKSGESVDNRSEMEFLIGSEWYWLTKEAQETFQSSWYQVSNEADRMGYRMAGNKLEMNRDEQLVSSAVSYGTVQLLPGGQLIILMADHQTTGGYPRIAYVISAHLPLLAQKKPNDVLRFKLTTLESSEEKIIKQKKYLQQLQIACKFKMENLIHAAL
jgi:antagonist of KipI